jgi:hypothetical protein
MTTWSKLSNSGCDRKWERFTLKRPQVEDGLEMGITTIGPDAEQFFSIHSLEINPRRIWHRRHFAEPQRPNQPNQAYIRWTAGGTRFNNATCFEVQ